MLITLESLFFNFQGHLDVKTIMTANYCHLFLSLTIVNL